MQYGEKFILKKSPWVVVVVFMTAHSKALLRYFAGPSGSIVFEHTNKVSIQIKIV